MEPNPTDGSEVVTPIDTPEGVAPIAADENAVDAPLEDSPTPEAEEVPADESAEEAEPQSERTRNRIQRLSGDKKAAMEYGNFWKAKAEELMNGQPQTPAPAEPAAPSLPKLEDFDYDQDAFSAALLNHAEQRANQTAAARVEELLQQRELTAQAQQADAGFSERATAFAAEHDDFEEVAFNPAVPITKEMGEVIKYSEKGPDLAYHLGQNPAEAYRISQMPPSMQAFELAKTELSLASPPPAATPKPATTKAPEPISPVGGAQPVLSRENETMEDFMTRRRKEMAAKRLG